MTRRLAMMAAVVLVAGLSGRVGAVEIIDQQDTNTTSAVGGLGLYAQSFTPTLNRIDFATFVLSSSSASPAATVVVDVITGDGYGGTLLGTSGPQTLSISSYNTVRFDFAIPISLTPTSIYTLLLRGTNSVTFASATDASATYTGGTAYYGNSRQPNRDLIFSEGANITAVPEPSTLAGAGLGLLCLAGAARKRRRCRGLAA